MIKSKRAYLPATADDGFRVLVERLWPRGLSKAGGGAGPLAQGGGAQPGAAQMVRPRSQEMGEVLPALLGRIG